MNCVYSINNIHSKELLYIGSCKKLKKRIQNHKSESKIRTTRKLYKHINFYGWNNFEFNILCENIIIPENNKHILRLFEEQYRKAYKPILNTFVCMIEGDKKKHLSTPIKCKFCEKSIQRWNMSKHLKICHKKLQEEQIIIEPPNPPNPSEIQNINNEM